VILGSRDTKKGEAAAATLRDEGITAESLGFDVTKSQDHQKAYEYFAKKYGRLDILVNNAGVLKENQISAAGSGPNPVSAVSSETLRETFETNFFAPVALTQKLLPLINKAPAGRIVNVSSILSSLTLHSDPNSPIYEFKTFAYDASKAALNSFTVHLAYELRDNKIKVNSAHPGWVKTEMGGPNAPMELSEGGKTSVQLATLPDNGANGGFFHLGQQLPWEKQTKERNTNEEWKTKRKSCSSDRRVERNRRRHRERVCVGRRLRRRQLRVRQIGCR